MTVIGLVARILISIGILVTLLLGVLGAVLSIMGLTAGGFLFFLQFNVFGGLVLAAISPAFVGVFLFVLDKKVQKARRLKEENRSNKKK